MSFRRSPGALAVCELCWCVVPLDDTGKHTMSVHPPEVPVRPLTYVEEVELFDAAPPPPDLKAGLTAPSHQEKP